MKALAIFSACTLTFLSAAGLAQGPAPADQRLREQIKTLTMQLRSAEAERATLQAEKVSLNEKIGALQKQSEEITKRLAEKEKEAKEEGERLQAEIAAAKAENDGTKNLLVKADAFGKQSAELARKTEAERARLAGENLQLKRVVADQRVKNARMFAIGNEILSRYQNFGLGTAITAREPFVGITRARLEALAEDYSGQLAGQRIRIDGTSPKPAETARAEAASESASKKRGSKP